MSHSNPSHSTGSPASKPSQSTGSSASKPARSTGSSAKKTSPNIPLDAARLRKARQQLGLTLEEASRQTSINKMTLQRYESGDIRAIAPERLQRLAALYHTTPAQLHGISPQQEFITDNGLSIVPVTADPATPQGRRLLACLDFLSDSPWEHTPDDHTH